MTSYTDTRSAEGSTSAAREKSDDVVRLSLALSPELNNRLTELATVSHTTKSEVLRKAVALYDVAFEARKHQRKLGILDSENRLVTEIIGL